MPIEVATEIHEFDQEQFHALDHRVMPIIFQVHKEFGGLLNERLFKIEIAQRCVESNLNPIEREVSIRVSHAGFTKRYYMDLLISQGFMLEAKTADALVPAHRKQALNYLFLTGMRHARLVNLRSGHVQHEFVSTRLTPSRRRHFAVIDNEWRMPNPESAWLKKKVIEIIEDWGAFLDVSLYREAIVWLLGGELYVCTPVRIFSGCRNLGNQNMDLLTEDTAFSFTSMVDSQDVIRLRQLQFLQHTDLKHVQWVNFNRHHIEFVTLSRLDGRPCGCPHDFVQPLPAGPQTKRVDKIIRAKS